MQRYNSDGNVQFKYEPGATNIKVLIRGYRNISRTLNPDQMEYAKTWVDGVLKEAARKGIRNVYATIWQNGAETRYP